MSDVQSLTADHAPTLFSPIQIGNKVTVPNRFFKSAMSEQLGNADYAPDHRLNTLYERWAAGGTGLLVTGNVMIRGDALGEPRNVVLENDSQLEAFKAWAAAAKRGNSEVQIWMQLNHPGKQSPKFLVPQPVAPSAVPLGKGLEKNFATPRTLEDHEIEELVAQFAKSAALAKEAGFTGVQIHGAHGYLVSQFLSPHHNRREDKWGGSPENRRRFVVEILRAMRIATGGDFPIGIKMNSADFQKGGFTEEESLELIKVLNEEGIDLIEVSGGNYENPAMVGARSSTKAREAYFLEFAEKAKSLSRAPLVVTGGFRSVAGMEEALVDGSTDMIGLARPLALYPDLPRQAAARAAYRAEVKEPTTGFRSLDRMFMLAITYFETQLARIGAGKNPKPGMSAWWTVWDAVKEMGASSFKKRRA